MSEKKRARLMFIFRILAILLAISMIIGIIFGSGELINLIGS